MDWNNMNDLNNPPSNMNNCSPSEETNREWVSRIARELVIPVLVPLSTAIVGWFAHRRISIQLRELQKEKEQVADMKQDMESLHTKDKALNQETSATMVVRRRRLLEEAILREEEEATQKVLADLEKLRPLLKQRQDIYCSLMVHRSHRYTIEEELKRRAYDMPYDKDLLLYKGMLDILQNDTSCGGAERKGCLMWVYLHFWETQAQLLKYKRVAERMKSIDEPFT